MVRFAPLLLLIALGSGCKGMGAFESGLGHAAGDLGHVASAVEHVAGAAAVGVARAAPAVARGTGVALQVGETVAEAAMWPSLDDDVVVVTTDSGPRDPCMACPIEIDCDICAGFANYACRVAPASSGVRCESTAPPDAPPVEPGY